MLWYYIDVRVHIAARVKGKWEKAERGVLVDWIDPRAPEAALATPIKKP